MKILLVSGNPRVSSQVRTALVGRPDVEIVEVAAPQRALQQVDAAEPGTFDVVIADNDTHPTGGLFLARDLKAREQMGRDVPPIILLLARPQDVWLANWSQADATVLKPVNPFDLAEAVDAVVHGHPVPALPGIASDPTPSLLDVPGGAVEAGGFDAHGGITGGGP